PDRIAIEYFYSFPVLRGEREQFALNRTRGDWGTFPYVGFDYWYQKQVQWENTYSARVKKFSAVILDTQYEFPDLLIRPVELFDRVKSIVGAHGIETESEEFNRRFRVVSADRFFADEVLQPRAIELLLASPRFHIHFLRHAVMVG